MALCRVLERWIAHFHGVQAAIVPVREIPDGEWVWHVGLDAEATAMLNEIYAGPSRVNMDVMAAEHWQRIAAAPDRQVNLAEAALADFRQYLALEPRADDADTVLRQVAELQQFASRLN